MKRVAVLLAAALLGHYAVLLTNGVGNLWMRAIEPGWTGWQRTLGFAFNSMLLHLLRGEVDVDPVAIKWEAMITGDGKTYAYFGILPALVRLPLLPFFDFSTTDVSALTCLAAVALAAAAKLDTLRAIAARVPDAGARRPALIAAAVLFALGGAQIQFLRVSVYQEAMLWAGALAAVFVNVAVRGLLLGTPFSTARLVALAALAGLAVHARVSTGIGLCVAVTLLLARRLARDVVAGSLGAWRVAAPVATLALLLAVAGLVNHARFGHPAAFAAPRLQTQVHGGTLPGVEHYGEFSIRRLPYGLMYYFTPVWFVRVADGRRAFDDFRSRAVDLVELPPSSFLLTDPLLLVLAVLGVAVLAGRGPAGVDRSSAGALALGLAVPPALMLSFFAMTFRYRGEFYPLLELLTFLALAFSPVVARVGDSPRLRRALVALVAFSVVAAHAALVFYKASLFGNLEPRAEVSAIYAKYLGQAFTKFLP